jgi:beta-glucosidase
MAADETCGGVVSSNAASESIAERIAALDLASKIRLLSGSSWFTLASEPSIGLAEMRLSDGLTGVRGVKFHGGPKVTLFPGTALVAASWDPSVAYRIGELLAEDARRQDISLVFGPTLNLHRSPLGGRLSEAYSEDPLLTGVMAAATIRGLQDGGVGALAKHLVANDSETDRDTVNCVIDEATLRELYLLPFEIAVEDADPWAMLSAYNGVNGVPCTEHDHVNNDILKGEWGYSGALISELTAARSTVPTAMGGLDIVLPGPGWPWGDQLVAAVESGEVPESVIDDHLGRLLRLADRAGGLLSPQRDPRREAADHSAELTRIAAGSMTVLSNRDEMLPLSPESSVALIGRLGIETSCVGGGSAAVESPYEVSIAEGLRARLGARLDVVDGVEVRSRPVPARPDFVTNPANGQPGVGFTLLAADGSVIEERHSTTATTLVGLDDDLPVEVHSIRVRARVDRGGPLQVGVLGVGAWELTVGGVRSDHRLEVAGDVMGEEFLQPPITTTEREATAGEVIEATVVPGHIKDYGCMFGLVARPAPRDADAVIAEAAEAAAHADVAVVVVGLTSEQETESQDKTTLALPGAQDRLVHAVASAAQRTVVIVNAATPVLMPWLHEVDAVLWVGLPGQEAGHAVAAALLGDVEPAGRLVTSFPRADGAAPAWSVTPTDGDLRYSEGRFIGYRGHRAGIAPAPEFWFGHGLGYATWSYDRAHVVDADVPTVVVTITNTGRRPSREVVQLYLQPDDPLQPVRLVGWTAASVAPGESAEVTVASDERLLRHWDQAVGAWSRQPPRGKLLLARGLGDVRAELNLPSGITGD